MNTPSHQYPTQHLLFFVAQDVNDEIRRVVRNAVNQLARIEPWVTSPPAFVDAVDDNRTRPEDSLDITIGGELDIYSSMGGKLPRDLDIATLSDVERVVKAMQELSRDHSLAISFELDGEFVGEIEDGKIDRCLEIGLIGEWRRHLGL